MHRLHYCDKRPEAPAAAEPAGPREDLARNFSTVIIPNGPPPEEAAAVPPNPPKSPVEVEPLDQDMEEEPEPEEPHWLTSTIFFFLLLVVGVVALIVVFWNVIEREGKKILKHFDPPAQGMTDDCGRQPLTE